MKKDFVVEIEDLDPQTVYFFIGERLTSEDFNKVLKLFMNGMRVFLDVYEMDQKLLQKLEVFFAENNIQTPHRFLQILSVIFKTPISQ